MENELIYALQASGIYFIIKYINHEVVYSHNTNTRPAINDKNTLMGLNSIYDFFKNNE